MTVITRFAPSPTGYLHIGSARTALFNYLFAKANKGKFLLRIEDTDKERSTLEAKEAILRSLAWLNLHHDGEVVYQSSRAARHQEVALDLVAKGRAYYCFSSQDEIAALREEALAKKQHFIFHSPWRDADAATFPKDIKPVVRLRAPHSGTTTVRDLLQGDVVVQNSHLDDMVLLRSDGSPTYMLAVVVDDHDMGVTHIIRGDDHLSNAHRQQLLYEQLEWAVPFMVHIPLIHGSDGAKLSKRHGALGAEAYRDMGYLPEALCNYLLRLGWAHGNDEIISRAQALEWFSLEGLGKAPARLDFDKLRHVNAHYLRNKTDSELASLAVEFLKRELGEISSTSEENILKAIPALKPRVELLTDLYQMAKIYVIDVKLPITEEAQNIINETENLLLEQVRTGLKSLSIFSKEAISSKMKEIAEESGLKIGELMHFVRAFIAGDTKSPSVFEIMEIIGLQQSLLRLQK